MNYPQVNISLAIVIVSALFSSCSRSPVATNRIEGLPVYKFLNLGDHKGRKELRVLDSTGTEISIYIKSGDYNDLWVIDPYDLHKMGKSHFVTIQYYEREDNGHRLNWATSFEFKMVDQMPNIRK